MIHYHKGKLNPADRSSHCLDYTAEKSDTAVARLMLTLWNKLVKASLATASPGACEQLSIQEKDSCTVSLI